jgi:hypothetical protein
MRDELIVRMITEKCGWREVGPTPSVAQALIGTSDRFSGTSDGVPRRETPKLGYSIGICSPPAQRRTEASVSCAGIGQGYRHETTTSIVAGRRTHRGRRTRGDARELLHDLESAINTRTCRIRQRAAAGHRARRPSDSELDRATGRAGDPEVRRPNRDRMVRVSRGRQWQ